jgi:hypothetical protein
VFVKLANFDEFLEGKYCADFAAENVGAWLERLADDRHPGVQGAQTGQSGRDEIPARTDVPDGGRPGQVAQFKAPT